MPNIEGGALEWGLCGSLFATGTLQFSQLLVPAVVGGDILGEILHR